MSKLLFDFFPIVLFFGAYKFGGVYAATMTAIIATLAQIAWVWWRGRKIEMMLWVSLVLVVVFGGATLLLHDENFIKWKPTVLYWVFAATLAGSRLLRGRNLVQALMQGQLQLPAASWDRLNITWVGYFVLMGAANWWVASHYTTAQWVNFKLFGTLVLTALFALVQGVLISRDLRALRQTSPE